MNGGSVFKCFRTDVCAPAPVDRALVSLHCHHFCIVFFSFPLLIVIQANVRNPSTSALISVHCSNVGHAYIPSSGRWRQEDHKEFHVLLSDTELSEPAWVI